MKPIPLLSLEQQHKALSKKLKKAVGDVLDSGVFILGPQGKAFEAEFAKTLGLERVLGVDSGTSALELALIALGVGPGDEVIVPTFTFIATATAVSTVGAKPVMVDVDWETMTIDVKAVKKAITPRTKAIIPVHLFGQPADMSGLKAFGLPLIEDCAQAHLSKSKGRPCGGIGDVACFSFYPSKNLGAAGDAGAVTATNPAVFRALEVLRNCGREPGGAAYRHMRLGFNCRLDEMQAAVLRVKLPQLRKWTKARQRLAGLYAKGLAGLPVTLPPMARGGDEPTFHLFALRTERRDELMAHLKAHGVGCGVYYPIPVHRQPAYAGLGLDPASFPVAERCCREVVALPLYPELSDADANRVVKTVRAFFHA